MTHRVSFRGSIVDGGVQLGGSALVLADAHLASATERLFGGRGTVFVPVEARPDRTLIDEVAALAKERRATTVAGVGSGYVLDAAKLVGHDLEGAALVLVPCGREPYRAVTEFAVVDDGTERPTVVDPKFAAATVLLVPELLSTLSDDVVALGALDTAVHCIESLLSTRAHPHARMLAGAALRHAVAELGTTVESRQRLTLAAFTAVEAFATTKLGLAHALASPLGTRARLTHDAINGVLGKALIEFWGDDVPGFGLIAAGFGVENNAGAVLARLAAVRERAGVPESLSELGIAWDLVAEVLPGSAQSSGIPVLPRRLSPADLEEFARLAWSGRAEKEMAYAQPA